MLSLIFEPEGVSALDKFIVMNSITNAIKARKLLSREGIWSRLVKLDVKNSGCNNGIAFDESYFYSVVKVLRENEIAYSLYNGNVK